MISSTLNGMQITLPAHVDASEEEFLQWLTVHMIWSKPGVIVEAGTFMGHFALVAAKTAHIFGFPAHVWTADVKDFGLSERIESNDLHGCITEFRGDFAAMLDTHLGVRSVDLAYIDSGPTHGVDVVPEVRWEHLAAVMPYMKRGGLIIVDDTQTKAHWPRKDQIRAMGVTIGDAHRAVTLIEAR